MREEISVNVKKTELQGILQFHHQGDEVVYEVHVFRILDYDNNPIESAEMNPAWFEIVDIPYDQMWPDDAHWLPLYLAGKKFEGDFIFKKSGEIIEFELNEVARFST